MGSRDLLFQYVATTATENNTEIDTGHDKSDGGGAYPPSVIARFEKHVDRSGGPDACHPWTACLDTYGYGSFTLADGSSIGAHRFALGVKLGRPLRRGEVSRHSAKCTTRACCNDKHLKPGSIADNNRDMVEAGRQARGERHAFARLTTLDVEAIRIRPGRAKDIAAEYGISDRQVYYLRNGQRWKHITAPSTSVSQ